MEKGIMNSENTVEKKSARYIPVLQVRSHTTYAYICGG